MAELSMEQEEVERLVARASEDVDSIYEILVRVDKNIEDLQHTATMTNGIVRRHDTRLNELARAIDGVQGSVDALRGANDRRLTALEQRFGVLEQQSAGLEQNLEAVAAGVGRLLQLLDKDYPNPPG